MNSVFLVVLLAAAATAALVSNDVPDVVLSEENDVDVNEPSKVFVTDVEEPSDETDAAGDTAVASRRNLSVGTMCSTLIYNYEHLVKGSAAGHQHVTDIRVETRGWITAVRVTRIGESQNATPSITSGGVGSSFVAIRLRSATGKGFHYRVQIYDMKK